MEASTKQAPTTESQPIIDHPGATLQAAKGSTMSQSEPPQDLSSRHPPATQLLQSALSTDLPAPLARSLTPSHLPSHLLPSALTHAPSQQESILPATSTHLPPPSDQAHPLLATETTDVATEHTLQSNESLPFDKGYRPWNRGTKETQSKMATRPTRPDAPVLWTTEANDTYSTKDALTLQKPTGEGQEDVSTVYGALRLPELLKPLKSREPTHAIPALERIGVLLRNLAASMMQIIEEDNRHMWSIEQLQAILQGDDTFSEELALDANDRNMIKCKDVTQVFALFATSLFYESGSDELTGHQDFINVRKAYIEAISATRQRIIHLIRARQWLVAHLKEVERNDKHYLATKRDAVPAKR